MTTAQAFRTIFFMGMSLWTAGGMHIELATPAHAKKITALRTPAPTQSLILADIDSMLAVNTYRDSDPVTWAHESTHGIASRIRQLEGPRRNGFYCLYGEYITLAEPDFTLAKLADSIPKAYRGVIYDLYLVQQQAYWNDTPSYVFDEGFAYLNGTLVGLELWLDAKRVEASYVRALEACAYCMFLETACPAQDMKAALGVLMARNVAIYGAIADGPYCTAAVVESYRKFAQAANERTGTT